jgi:hypothetical protein
MLVPALRAKRGGLAAAPPARSLVTEARMSRRFALFAPNDPYPSRLPRRSRFVLAVLAVVWTLALVAMLLYPSLQR